MEVLARRVEEFFGPGLGPQLGNGRFNVFGSGLEGDRLKIFRLWPGSDPTALEGSRKTALSAQVFSLILVFVFDLGKIDVVSSLFFVYRQLLKANKFPPIGRTDFGAYCSLTLQEASFIFTTHVLLLISKVIVYMFVFDNDIRSTIARFILSKGIHL
jgi:hypothetical protein